MGIDPSSQQLRVSEEGNAHSDHIELPGMTLSGECRETLLHLHGIRSKAPEPGLPPRSPPLLFSLLLLSSTLSLTEAPEGPLQP